MKIEEMNIIEPDVAYKSPFREEMHQCYIFPTKGEAVRESKHLWLFDPYFQKCGQLEKEKGGKLTDEEEKPIYDEYRAEVAKYSEDELWEEVKGFRVISDGHFFQTEIEAVLHAKASILGELVSKGPNGCCNWGINEWIEFIVALDGTPAIDVDWMAIYKMRGTYKMKVEGFGLNLCEEEDCDW